MTYVTVEELSLEKRFRFETDDRKGNRMLSIEEHAMIIAKIRWLSYFFFLSLPLKTGRRCWRTDVRYLQSKEDNERSA